MNVLSTVIVVQIFFPVIVGLIFGLFPLEEERIRKINLYIYCIAYFILSLFSIIALIVEEKYFFQQFSFMKGPFFYPQKEIIKFLLISPLGYFFQTKYLENTTKNFSMNIFFQGIFFTLFNVSIYVRGAFSIYCVLELLVFSAIILSMINGNFWKKNNVILQGMGAALIMVSLIFISFLLEQFEQEGQIGILKNTLGMIDFRTALSLALLFGILLKSTIVEYGNKNSESIQEIRIYLSIIKLYLPIRFLLEGDIFQIMEFNAAVEWIILILCLINGLRITEKNNGLEILRLVELFSGLIILGFIILGSPERYILIKYYFYLMFLLIFYIDIGGREENNVFFFMLSAIAIIGIFYMFPKVIINSNRGLLFLTVIMGVLYLMIKYIWSSLCTRANKANIKILKFNRHFIQNIIIISIVLILIEMNMGFLMEKNFWLN